MASRTSRYASSVSDGEGGEFGEDAGAPRELRCAAERAMRRCVTPRIWARLSCISRAIRSRSVSDRALALALAHARADVIAIDARSDIVTRNRTVALGKGQLRLSSQPDVTQRARPGC